MRRREFIAGLLLAATMRGAVAQQPSKLKRIAMVHPTEKVGNMTISGFRDFRVFLEELGRLGYVEGQNLVVERYSGEGRTEGYADLARHIVSTHPDLIFSMTGRIALGLKKATTTIPIVAINSDPVALGLVQSLRAAWWQHHGCECRRGNRTLRQTPCASRRSDAKTV